MKLSELPFNTLAKIKSIDKKVTTRVAAMGILLGTDIKVIRASPLGDPLELEVKNYNLSLRKSVCKLIEVERI